MAVLVAIAIPIFTSQLEKARVATDQANVRGWYAEEIADYLTDGDALASSYSGPSLKAAGAKVDISGSGETWSVSYSATLNGSAVTFGG